VFVYGRRNFVDIQTSPAPFKIVNLGVNGSAFVFEGGGNVLTHIGDTDRGDFGLV
jgi:hypothetical protein